jgi:hypothetical protein
MLFNFDCLLTHHLISHHVFPTLEKSSKGCNHEGGDADKDHIK